MLKYEYKLRFKNEINLEECQKIKKTIYQNENIDVFDIDFRYSAQFANEFGEAPKKIGTIIFSFIYSGEDDCKLIIENIQEEVQKLGYEIIY